MATPRQDAATSLTTYRRVDAPVYCVLTRVHLQYLRVWPAVLWLYHKVRRQARQVPALKECALLWAGPRTFFILSIWEGEQGYLDFGTCVQSHVEAAGAAFAWMVRSEGKPEVWSTEWRIWAASHNVNWGDPAMWERLWAGGNSGSTDDGGGS
jgi:hypothetical protein